MEINRLENLAPWVAIAITLALSILVPLFTQIANNRFQLKLQRCKEMQESKRVLLEEKKKIYSDFLKDVGACIIYNNKENFSVVGASVQRMYLICPEDWWKDIDEIYSCLKKGELAAAEIVLRKLNKLIANEYANIEMARFK